MHGPTKIEVRTDDGLAPCFLHRPDSDGRYPGVIMYPDAGSIRPVSMEMAARLAGYGYVVLLPHIFYRAGEYKPFDVKTVFQDPPEKERLMALVRSLDLASAMRDARHYIRTLEEQASVSPGRVGCVGYCIGGRLAFTTAGVHTERVGAAASIHGGMVASDQPDSPHKNASKIQAKLYFAVADNDPSCTPEQQGMLVSALAGAHIDFSVEHFADCKHGFAMPDFPVYDQTAAERQWDRVRDLFQSGLGSRAERVKD
jgi:carboxymethylenebutenolidase